MHIHEGGEQSGPPEIILIMCVEGLHLRPEIKADTQISNQREGNVHVVSSTRHSWPSLHFLHLILLNLILLFKCYFFPLNHFVIEMTF